VRAWRPASPAVAALVTLVLLGQIVSAGNDRLWPYIFVTSVIGLDVLGVISSVRATRRGDASSWWPAAAARAFSVISITGMAFAASTGSLTAWWLAP
jgi:hypothetical protein